MTRDTVAAASDALSPPAAAVPFQAAAVKLPPPPPPSETEAEVTFTAAPTASGCG
jgi:hypothetical protein